MNRQCSQSKRAVRRHSLLNVGNTHRPLYLSPCSDQVYMLLWSPFSCSLMRTESLFMPLGLRFMKLGAVFHKTLCTPLCSKSTKWIFSDMRQPTLRRLLIGRKKSGEERVFSYQNFSRKRKRSPYIPCISIT